MERDKVESLKKRIDSLGRKAIADATGMQYSTLSQKLNGFLPVSEDDAELIESGIKMVEQAKKAA